MPAALPTLFDTIDLGRHALALMLAFFAEDETWPNESSRLLTRILEQGRQVKLDTVQFGAWLKDTDLLRWDLMLTAWSQNHVHLGEETQALALESLDSPNKDTLRRLNSCRSASLRLSNDIAAQHRETVSKIDHGSDDIAPGERPIDKWTVDNRIAAHSDIVRRFDGLNDDLKEAFQTLIAGISIADSEANKNQASRSTMLTLLAAIYLPLSLATGIFGMNIKEINDGVPRAWQVFATLGILLCPSIGFIFWLFKIEACRALWRRIIPSTGCSYNPSKTTITTKSPSFDTSSQYCLESLESGQFSKVRKVSSKAHQRDRK